jgi:hypothetical protein
MRKDEMFTAIVAQRREFADTLDSLSEADWIGAMAVLAGRLGS